MEWFYQLPVNLRPNESKSEALEALRLKYRLPNEIFWPIVASSAATTRKAQKNIYEQAKELMPDSSEKEILESVFRNRVFPKNPAGLKMTEEEIQKSLDRIHSLDDLVNYIIEVEKDEPRFKRDFLGIGKRVAKKVDAILLD